MRKRKTAPTKPTEVKLPKVSDPPKYETQNYPPGELPEITRDELRALTENPEPGDEDIELIRREDKRAQRKIGYFKALTDRPDTQDRQASAEATVVFAGIDSFVMHGAKVQKGRGRGGKKTGRIRRKAGDITKQKVFSERDRLLRANRSPREIAGIISRAVGMSASQVRRILAAEKKARTS